MKKSSSSSSSVASIKPIKTATMSKSEDVKCLVKHKGRVITILNDSFGLLVFSQESSKPNYCLFDTFDLYLEGGKSAAQSKKTVADVLKLDMEIYFHACEILPDSPVSWLATGVWRHESGSQPKPVAYRKITKEKISVFKKVAETCKVLVVSDSDVSTSEPVGIQSPEMSNVDDKVDVENCEKCVVKDSDAREADMMEKTLEGPNIVKVFPICADSDL